MSDVMMVGDSAPMRRLRALVTAVAPSRVPVLVQGETGTGKELVAAALHEGSGRRGQLVAFNVCAIGESMFEDALFGHVRGAFTGAHSESAGFLREADGGTAFLDEIGSLPPSLQAKLLRAIETGVFRPLGARRDARSDFRLVAATNERLSELVRDGRFRSDLAHRLGGFVIQLPRLEERLDDVPELVHHFVSLARPGDSVAVEPEAIALLQAQAWPGNVRELKHVIDVAAVFARTTLSADHVRLAMDAREPSGGASEAARGLAERDALVLVLEGCGWDIDDAAAHLGVHRATLYRRMKRLQVERREVTAARVPLGAGYRFAEVPRTLTVA